MKQRNYEAERRNRKMIWMEIRGRSFVVDERRIEFFCSRGDVCCCPPQEVSFHKKFLFTRSFFSLLRCLLVDAFFAEHGFLMGCGGVEPYV